MSIRVLTVRLPAELVDRLNAAALAQRGVRQSLRTLSRARDALIARAVETALSSPVQPISPTPPECVCDE